MIKIFADGADLEAMYRFATGGFGVEPIAGFTTNPSIVRKAGVKYYEGFAAAAATAAYPLPVSIEVLADDFDEMARQARSIASWGPNVFVKIPVMNTRGEPSTEMIRELSVEGMALNVTAVFTKDQVRTVGAALAAGTGPAIVSVFAGRIADAGVDPLDHMSRCHYILQSVCPRAELLWASPRQVYDVILAERAKCEIITMTPDMIAKLPLVGKDLTEYSRETVEMFYRDAQAAGFTL